MRFGTYHVIQCPPGQAPARVVAEEIARAELAEALGFDDIWLPEQHFSPYCLAGDALLLAGNLAARTRRVQIGTAVVNLTLPQPPSLTDARHPMGVSLLLILVMRVASTAQATIPLTTCGQTIPAGETGEVMNDLQCPTTHAVSIEGIGTLRLNGFSIVGGTDRKSMYDGITCLPRPSDSPCGGPCIIIGPGTISGFARGINSPGYAFKGSRRCRPVYMQVRDLAVRENRQGISGVYLELTNLVVDDNETWGISGGSGLRGTSVRVTNNRDGGVSGSKVDLAGLLATGNGPGGGLSFRYPSRLTDSFLTGNDGLGQGYDIVAFRRSRLRLRNTTCGRVARVRSFQDDTPRLLRSFDCAR
jgi:hypothetical protein